MVFYQAGNKCEEAVAYTDQLYLQYSWCTSQKGVFEKRQYEVTPQFVDTRIYL